MHGDRPLGFLALRSTDYGGDGFALRRCRCVVGVAFVAVLAIISAVAPVLD